MTDQQFTRALSGFKSQLRRHSPGSEHLTVNEWDHRGRRHAHVLLTAPSGLSRRVFAAAKRAAGLRGSCRPVRDPVAAVKYVFKSRRQDRDKATLRPASFRGGKLWTASRGFLVKSWAKLWAGVRAELNEGEEMKKKAAVGHPVRVLPVESITVDGGLQARAAGTDEATVVEYTEAIAGGAELPPLVVYRSAAGTNWLSQGHHRLAAHRRAGAKKVRCEVRKGERADALVDACGSNAAHGLRRSSADKRRAVGLLLAAFPTWSNRRIEQAAGVSDALVADVRRTFQVPESGTCPPAARVGLDGKTYPVQVPESGTCRSPGRGAAPADGPDEPVPDPGPEREVTDPDERAENYSHRPKPEDDLGPPIDRIHRHARELLEAIRAGFKCDRVFVAKQLREAYAAAGLVVEVREVPDSPIGTGEVRMRVEGVGVPVLEKLLALIREIDPRRAAA